MVQDKTKPPAASQASIRQKHYLASRHTSPALKTREQTYAMKQDSSGSSDVVLDGSYDRRVFCHILVIAIQAGFCSSVGEQAALRDSIIHHNETRARLREQQRLSH